MARSRAPTFEGQRAAILAGAAGLFARQGYHATSMNDVANECGLSKATLYHYYRDKYALLLNIADTHVARLVERVKAVEGDASLPKEDVLRVLITQFLEEYAGAQNAHRVLTEDVKFLDEADRERVLGKQRLVVEAFARAVSRVRPDLHAARLDKVVTMLLFGMLNWMFMWLRPDGKLSHASLAPIVCDLFLHGLHQVGQSGEAAEAPRAIRARRVV